VEERSSSVAKVVISQADQREREGDLGSHTVKKAFDIPVSSDIPAWDGNIEKLFLLCNTCPKQMQLFFLQIVTTTEGLLLYHYEIYLHYFLVEHVH